MIGVLGFLAGAIVACLTATQLRQEATECHPEAVREDSAAFWVRAREVAKPPGRELDFIRSDVELAKDGKSVTVHRIPST